jgi:hypothetical protein
MKDHPEEWKMPVIPKKVPKYKQKVEVGPSQHSTNPTVNTRKVTKNENKTGGSTNIKKPRKKKIIPKDSAKEKEHLEEPN